MEDKSKFLSDLLTINYMNELTLVLIGCNHIHLISFIKNDLINLSKTNNLKKIHLSFQYFCLFEITLKEMFTNLNSVLESLVLSDVVIIYNNKNFYDGCRLNILYSLSSLKELTLININNISDKDMFELSHHLTSLKSIRIVSARYLFARKCLTYFDKCQNKSFS